MASGEEGGGEDDDRLLPSVLAKVDGAWAREDGVTWPQLRRLASLDGHGRDGSAAADRAQNRYLSGEDGLGTS